MKFAIPLGLALLAALIAGLPLLPGPTWPAQCVWAGVLLLMVAFMLLAGYGITGRWTGVLIDEHNTMSLSRFQTALWTALILSAFLVAALRNVAGHVPNPLDVGVPKEMWALMGISLTSLVASPLILSTKDGVQTVPPPTGPAGAGNPATPPAPAPALANQAAPVPGPLGSPVASTQSGMVPVVAPAPPPAVPAVAPLPAGPNPTPRKEIVAANAVPSEARWSDLFTGELVGNFKSLDLTRVQMFFFTIVTVVVYAADLWALFGPSGSVQVVHKLPALDSSMVTLLGISHTGYLAAKAAPRSV